jgi:hypothetical protein
MTSVVRWAEVHRLAVARREPVEHYPAERLAEHQHQEHVSDVVEHAGGARDRTRADLDRRRHEP